MSHVICYVVDVYVVYCTIESTLHYMIYYLLYDT